MNKNDSERIAGLLLSAGLAEAARPEEADILIINTCSVRQTAEDRVYGLVDGWQKFREKNPDLIIAVTGCMPGRDKDGKLRAKLPGVDLFFGIEELPKLPKWIRELRGASGNPPLRGVGGCWRRYSDYLQLAPARKNNFQAFVTIQTGCDNFCSYCVVPYARGREKNRPLKDILDEIKNAVAAGAKEITLLGQVVNNYQAPDAENFSSSNPFCHSRVVCHPEFISGSLSGCVVPPTKYGGIQMDNGESVAVADHFAALLWEVNQIAGVKRLHWTAADPQYFNAAQIEALALPQQVNYLHLPAQSGDNEILKKMNRYYTREQYIDLIKKIRAAAPDIAIGTDLIAGFPGETEEQFQNTVNLYKQCDFDIAYLAMYSERSGTAAARAFKDDITRAEKKRRWRILQNLMEETTLRKNQKYLGRTVSVLVDNYSLPAREPVPNSFREGDAEGVGAIGICTGNSREMKLTRFVGGADLIGEIVNVKITKPEMWILRGELV